MMLVLVRKQGEQIVIDGESTITMLGIKGSKVRLGIEAPREVTIRRHEQLHTQPKKEEITE